MKLRRNLSGIFIFDKLEGLEKEALIRCVEHLCDTLNEIGETFNIYKE